VLCDFARSGVFSLDADLKSKLDLSRRHLHYASPFSSAAKEVSSCRFPGELAFILISIIEGSQLKTIKAFTIHNATTPQRVVPAPLSGSQPTPVIFNNKFKGTSSLNLKKKIKASQLAAYIIGFKEFN